MAVVYNSNGKAGGTLKRDYDLSRGQALPVQVSPEWQLWLGKRREALNYLASVKPSFSLRDKIAKESFELRHGLVPAHIPPSHADVIPDTTSRKSNEILARLTALLTAVFPRWTYKADSLSTNAGLRASAMSVFARSMFMALEERMGVSITRQMTDEQLAKGGSILKVNFRLDRWQNLPMQDADESDPDYRARVRDWKARNIPIDIDMPSYDNTYYDLTTEGLVRVAEEYRASVYDIASEFGGSYNEVTGILYIPAQLDTGQVDEYGQPILTQQDIRIPVGLHSREVDYVEYWVKGKCAIACVNETPIWYIELDPDLPLPYFLALGEVTSSRDPGRMGLPILYNAFSEFKQKDNLRAMENAFLYKHGFARMVRYRKPQNAPGTEEPESPDQELEEEVIGELMDMEIGEKVEYVAPANVSALFTEAKLDVEKEIESVALVDILMGKSPPAGTTGYLWGQMAVAATAKYVPILEQKSLALKAATNYIIDLFDRYVESDIVVNMATDERSTETYAIYKPKSSKGNRNLEIRIEAPLPSDIIPKTEWLMKLHQGGYISRERVQIEGPRIDDTALEDEKILVEKFQQMYEPMAMLKAEKRAGQFDLVLEAAKAGMLGPELTRLVAAFAQGPDGQQPAPLPGGPMGPGAITGNPNGVQAPQPGLGEPAQPTVGATANAQPPNTGPNIPMRAPMLPTETGLA